MSEGPGISLLVNGKSMQLPAGSTIADLLGTLSLGSAPVAVEHNRRVVPRAEHSRVRLNQGDALEVVTFVGGGTS